MSDKNPPTKGRLIASGTIRDDVFAHTFQRIVDDLKAIGLAAHSTHIENLRGKRVRIYIVQEPR